MPTQCKICRREFDYDPRVKLRHGHEQGLCPDCLFLCRRQNQLEGPEKTILRVLHEQLVRQGVADEKCFVLWNSMPNLAMPNPPRFWSESIFGSFLKRQYVVTYVAGGNRERIAAFAKDLHAVFLPPMTTGWIFSLIQGICPFMPEGSPRSNGRRTTLPSDNSRLL